MTSKATKKTTKATRSSLVPKNKREEGAIAPPGSLQGWSAIAEFLGQTPSVAQRWAGSGMPVVRDGRHVHASPQALTAWVGTEAGKTKPVHIAMENEDLLADLKEGLSYVRRKKVGPSK